jgi:hypothetical protein
MEKQLVQAENLTDEWLRRAKLALEKGMLVLLTCC